MNNFVFQNPTKLIFGKNTISNLAAEIPAGKKIMLTFGGGAVKSNGVYDQVLNALKQHDFIEFWGIEPNPTVETLRKAITLGKESNIDFLLAIGGGSVVDATKLISAAIPFAGDAWDLVLNPDKVGKMLPYASVITLPATGSEMNRGAVISNITTREKYAFYSSYPQFSILDPEVTYSLPRFQIACGVADTFVHVMEQYLTKTSHPIVMDRWAEGILLSLIELAPKVLQDIKSYEPMANFMLSATMALNGFIAMGAVTDWATHMIGHEITALTGITHGQTLAVILPATMRVMREQKREKLLQYAERVWGINGISEAEKIDLVIVKTEEFFRSLGLFTRLSSLGLKEEIIAEVTQRLNARGVRFGEEQNIDGSVARKILETCL